MKKQAEILVLAASALSARITERVRALGHGVFALVHTADEARQAVAQAGEAGPDLVLIDEALVGRALGDLAALGLAGVPAVYVSEREEVLDRMAEIDRDGDGAQDEGETRVVSSLAPRELSLAIQLARWRAQALGVDHARYRAMIEDNAEFVCRFVSDGVVTFANEATCRYFGKSTEELVGHSWIPLVYEGDLERVGQMFETLSPENPVITVEHRVVLASGEVRWTSWTNRVLLNGAGEIIEYQGVGRDVHERKMTEEALRASEARYRAIVEDQTELICRFLPSGPLTFVNEAYCRYFDKTSEELVGHSFMPLIPDEDREILERSFASLGLDNPVVTHEHRVLLPNGEIRWHSWTNRVVLDGAGEIIEYQAVGRDITERKQAEDALRRSEARYLSIFQRAAVPIWEEDITELLQALRDMRASGVRDLATYLEEHPEQAFALISRSKLVDMNDECLKLFGAESRAEMLRSHADIFLPESLPLLRAMLVALAEGKGHHACEIPLCTLQGERLILLMRVSFPTEGQGFDNMLLSCVDITDRKRAEEQIRQLNADLRRRAAELQAANTELESFSYSVSHDLRAPLRAIDGFSVAVIEDYADQLGERGKGYLRRVRQASQRMSRLIDDLLDLSRMTRSAMHLEACDMSAMAQAVIRELRKSQPERDVEVVIEPDMRVMADPGLLRVVLENLLGNAWKFTSKQPRAHIHMGTTEHEGRVAYFVRDDGAGFDMAHVGKLFGAFQRLHGMHDFEGTGIGLATVRRIIRRHGGDIWAAGKEGEGATFTFTLA